MLLLLAVPVQAAELWNEDGFKIESAGWMVPPEGAGWLGLKLGVTVPDNGYAVLDGPGSLEFYLPCKGWVADLGIIISPGCRFNPGLGKDTQGGALFVITHEMGCEQRGGRVMMVARLPYMFPTQSCRPTKVRWAGGYHEVDR